MRNLEIMERPPRIFRFSKNQRLGLGPLLGLSGERYNPLKQTFRWLWRRLADAWSAE